MPNLIFWAKKRKSQKKEDAGTGKGRKVAKHFVFPMICGPRGSKSRLAKKGRVRSHLARWEMKTCTPLWREAHLEVKMYKTLQNTSASDHFWKLRCRKSAPRCGAKHISKSKCAKCTNIRTLLEVDMSKKVHAVVARSKFQSQDVKSTTCSNCFWRFRCGLAWQAPLAKSEQNVRAL